MGKLDNKVAIITGGNAGVGKEIAKLFASEGAKVVISARRQQVLEEAAKEIEEAGGTVLCVPTDISKVGDVKNLVSKTVETFGQLDILINNAGITKDGLMLRMKESDFDQVIDVNLKGTWNCMKHATKLMMKQKYGRIINISSVGGIQAGPAQVSYFAAKGGVVNLTKAMAGDLAPYGILVNAIAPGVYDTEMTHDALDAPGSLVLKNRVALKRFGREGEMNGALIYFASDACTYTTGQLLVIDGGMTSML